MASAVLCSRLCTPPTDRTAYRDAQPVIVPCSITDEPLICRFSREFTMWKSCSWHADRSMGDQRTQINNRTANRGRLPMPEMCERRVCDSVDRSVNSAFQKMHCPRTAQVVSKDGSGVGTHQIRPRRIVIDVPKGFSAVVSTPRTTGHCITCFGIAR